MRIRRGSIHFHTQNHRQIVRIFKLNIVVKYTAFSIWRQISDSVNPTNVSTFPSTKDIQSVFELVSGTTQHEAARGVCP